MNIEQGAQIIIHKWVALRPWDRLMIVTNEEHRLQAEALRRCAENRRARVNILTVQQDGIHVGIFFDKNKEIFDPYTVIIAATDYSIATTLAAKRAIARRMRFLSLPLSTNDGRPMLCYDFLAMDTKKSRMMAKLLLRQLKEASIIRAVTEAGTDITVYKRKRTAGFFNGVTRDGGGFSSASIELYIPIEETKSHGTLVVDGSFGYIGRPETPTRVCFQDGKIVSIEDNAAGRRLQAFIDSYHDEEIKVAAEFGIGLNSLSHCDGNCYIEDESTYGTFHIGLGRNFALGGVHEASGHFDLVMHAPDLYVDNRLLMYHGRIILDTRDMFHGYY